jgi:hypothetical protein
MGTSSDLGAWWISLTLVNAGLAQCKGRDGLRWWGVSLFLGPVATLLLVIRPPHDAREPSAPLNVSEPSAPR